MRAISLWQPWGSLISIGAKQIETRSWRTEYRGPLAIHAARKWDSRNRPFAGQSPFKEALARAGFSPGTAPAKKCLPGQIPLGAIVAVCQLVAIVQTGADSGSCLFMEISSENPQHNYKVATRMPPGEPERSFGNYAPGRYAWLLANIVCLPRPIPFQGMQGLFNVPDHLIDAAMGGLIPKEAAHV